MGATLLGFRLLLAAMFATAGAAKLVDIGSFRQALTEFGIPRRAAGVAGPLIPVAELAVAIALIPRATAAPAAGAGALLLAGFNAATTSAILRGRRPECHCFGRLHSAPAGAGTLARTLALLALAVFVAAAGWNGAGLSATHWVTRLPAAGLAAIVAGVLTVAAGVLIVARSALAGTGSAGAIQAPQSPRRIRRRPPLAAEPFPAFGLPLGSAAPTFELPGVDGRRHSLRSLQAGGARPLLLVFIDARCRACDRLLPALAEWRHRLPIAVIASGDHERIRAIVAEHGLSDVLLQERREIAESYRVPGTPMAVLIGPEGTIASPTLASTEAIAALLTEAISPAPAPPPAVGDPTPPLTLPDLQGAPVALADLAATPTLVIFWSPTCERCQRMLLGLQTLEQELPPGAPRLVVISDSDEVRSQGLSSTVLIDPDREAMRRFGARGTPMSVLIADGRIATSVAPGAAGLVDLLDGVFARR